MSSEMIQAGQQVDAKVCRIEAYGVYLQYREHEILVLAPDLTWAPRMPAETVRIGDVLRVRILAYVKATGVYRGSVRVLDQAGNPYLKLAALAPGTVLSGRVRLVADDDITVELPDHMRGHLSRRKETSYLKCGDAVNVVVDEVHAEEEDVRLRVVE